MLLCSHAHAHEESNPDLPGAARTRTWTCKRKVYCHSNCRSTAATLPVAHWLSQSDGRLDAQTLERPFAPRPGWIDWGGGRGLGWTISCLSSKARSIAKKNQEQLHSTFIFTACLLVRVRSGLVTRTAFGDPILGKLRALRVTQACSQRGYCLAVRPRGLAHNAFHHRLRCSRTLIFEVRA